MAKINPVLGASDPDCKEARYLAIPRLILNDIAEWEHSNVTLS